MVIIKVMDQGALSTDEVARTVIPVNEVYESFFSGRECKNLNKDLHIGSKIRFFDRKSNQHVPELSDSAKSYELQFMDFRGPAYLWLAFMPANDEAEKFLMQIYASGFFGKLCSCFSRRAGGVGSPTSFEHSMYESLEQIMSDEATRPLTTRTNH